MKASVFISGYIPQSYYPGKRKNNTTVCFCPCQEDINSQQKIYQYHKTQNIYQSIQNIRQIFMKYQNNRRKEFIWKIRNLRRRSIYYNVTRQIIFQFQLKSELFE